MENKNLLRDEKQKLFEYRKKYCKVWKNKNSLHKNKKSIGRENVLWGKYEVSIYSFINEIKVYHFETSPRN